MIYRHLGRVLEEEARRNPVVTLVGPRQSGKTTLVCHVFPEHDYISLERPDRRSAAKQDPLGFLAAHRGDVILDEVQKVPELLSYIQVSVDKDDRPGRFVLTGSQHLLLMQDVSQTLAGRTAVLRLLPLSLAELLDREPIDPMNLPEVEPSPPPALQLWEVMKPV